MQLHRQKRNLCLCLKLQLGHREESPKKKSYTQESMCYLKKTSLVRRVVASRKESIFGIEQDPVLSSKSTDWENDSGLAHGETPDSEQWQKKVTPDIENGEPAINKGFKTTRRTHRQKERERYCVPRPSNEGEPGRYPPATTVVALPSTVALRR